MTKRKWPLRVFLVVLLVLVLLVVARQYFLQSLRSLPPDMGLAKAERARAADASNPKIDAGAKMSKIRDQPSADRLRTLFVLRDVRAAAVEAGQSEDPVLWVRSIELWSTCLNPRFAPPFTDGDIANMRGTSTTTDVQTVVNLQRKMRDLPPLRLVLPEPYGSFLNNAVATGLSAFDPAMDAAIEKAIIAPVATEDAAARERILLEMRQWCQQQSGDQFFEKFRAARMRWAAQGGAGALMQNAQAGWTSKGFDELAEKHFELVSRVVRDRLPDGLAKLLSPGNAFSLKLVSEGDTLDWSAMMAGFAANGIVATLSGCELGVDDCSADSPRFKELCIQFGGCHLTNVAELGRYVFARDGLDPTWMERESQRVVNALYANDLAALGIRRRPADKR